MLILGIETSCDETAAAIVDENGTILAHRVYSQMKEHTPHGGVVPEIAARAHADILPGLVQHTCAEAHINAADLDAIAATCGPGLIGGVMVGMMMGKGLAASLNKPFIAINHLEAHVLTPRLTHQIPFPYLCLLISGGHTQMVLVRDLGHYDILGESLDDAAGEAFDKSAKMMGLPYPGGLHVEKEAAQCEDPENARHRFPLPRPLMGRKGCDFSFSGLKTAVRQTIAGHSPLSPLDRIDLCFSLQETIGDILSDRLSHALPYAASVHAKHFVLAGGVAANMFLRQCLASVAEKGGMDLVAPPLPLCTDNGAMIAWAGAERFKSGFISNLNTAARPRWPLSEMREVS